MSSMSLVRTLNVLQVTDEWVVIDTLVIMLEIWNAGRESNVNNYDVNNDPCPLCVRKEPSMSSKSLMMMGGS